MMGVIYLKFNSIRCKYQSFNSLEGVTTGKSWDLFTNGIYKN